MLQLLCLVVLTLAWQPVLSLYNCSSLYERVPNNDDLKVDCGISVIKLEVNLCTAQWAGFDPTGLAMNGMHNNSQCKGVIDTSVDPPVIRYALAVNDSQGNLCRQSLQIVDEIPSASGPFSDFSNIQSVIISSFIDTPTSSSGIVSYSTDLYYRFSCRYPLAYLMNNTKIVASSVSLATNDKNGSFIDNLSMSVYNDSTFFYPLLVPQSGLQLRTKVYIEVKAVNLSGNFNLLLDHCFATPSPYTFNNSEQLDFFTVCNTDPRTIVMKNGISKNSRFSFETFRFVEHRNQDKSSIYIHCFLRLCEPDKCLNIINGCNGKRRKRSVEPGQPTTASMSIGPLYTAAQTEPTAVAYAGVPGQSNKSHDNTSGVVVGAIFASAGALLLVLAGWFVLKKVW
ncbi:zona pellucida-like domain-containing protein 1 isoform X1 [Tachysurus fulvidraco]|uniref:zona pellucida-like domain-containing protein 1 isoform X1 n=1 Tax=Tachysurus fulvidraco TaxID=1234273 RepID=UPI001FEDED8B|nr:zona pellucida-like domain-containing protein 1 isoform X1 [Tachysurus fulvidraco]